MATTKWTMDEIELFMWNKITIFTYGKDID